MGKRSKDEEGSEPLPLPDPTLLRRPGTSGTEMGLRTERQKASSAYARAQRAEQAYRAKKLAGNARTHASAGKLHYKAAWKSLKIGTRFFGSAIVALPGLWGEKRAEMSEKKEGVKREKTIKKRRRWEEKLKRDDSTSVDGGDGVALEDPQGVGAVV